MFSITDLKVGTTFLLDGQPYEVLEYKHTHLGRGGSVVQARIKNLLTGAVFNRSFKQADQFQEAEIEKIKSKFLYSHKGQYFFCEENNAKSRFLLTEKELGEKNKYLKPNLVLDVLYFQKKPVGIILPIKIDLKVIEAPPGVKGDTAQGGTKTAILETGAQVKVPLFINEGDIIRINAETDEYIERVEKK